MTSHKYILFIICGVQKYSEVFEPQQKGCHYSRMMTDNADHPGKIYSDYNTCLLFSDRLKKGRAKGFPDRNSMVSDVN